MPDVHWGMGATIGSVIATKGAIIPAAVGVDIGCGMRAARTNIKANYLPDNLKGLRSAIEEAVPHGGPGDIGSWQGTIPDDVCYVWYDRLFPDYNVYSQQHPGIKSKNNNRDNQLGTLGTGNHFIEICLDENKDVWIMLHSGSRGCGNRIGTYFIDKAKKEMERWFIDLPDKNLAYFPEGSPLFDDYIEAVGWAQQYAKLNRALMFKRTLQALCDTIGGDVCFNQEAIDCHHNYVTRENHFGSNVLVTRKGAVQAREGTMGIIPGSMGAKSFIVRGKGNPDSFNSCSHGAGRVMSRNEARKTITQRDHETDTAGVECRKDESVIDESPKAYKNIDDVMKSQEDLVEIVHTLKQVVCVKG